MGKNQRERSLRMRDEQFWSDHYAKFGEQEPSPFCRHCVSRILLPTDTVVEIGCGNGRDGLVIARRVSKYIGLDTSRTAVEAFRSRVVADGSGELRSLSVRVENAGSFDLRTVEGNNRLAVFSRFSLHSLSTDEQSALLNRLAAIDARPWICMIEARTTYDELYGVGERVGPHEFVTDHYRRFIEPNEFLSETASRFAVLSFELSRGLAVYKNEDPRVMRIVFSRREP